MLTATTLPTASGRAPLSLADHAYEHLRDRLTTLEIRPGEPIHEARLASEMGIGRTPLREAIKRLTTDHLVVSYPRRGTFATQVDITELSDVSEVRRSLEPVAARKAALAASDEDRRQMVALARTIEELSSGGHTRRTLMQADLTVHRLIYRTSGNPHLEETLVRLDNLATRIWCLVLDRVPVVAGHVMEHVKLLEAVARGEADHAADLALEHVIHFDRTMRSIL